MGEGTTNHPTISKIRSLHTHSQTCKLRSFSLFLFLSLSLSDYLPVVLPSAFGHFPRSRVTVKESKHTRFALSLFLHFPNSLWTTYRVEGC